MPRPCAPIRIRSSAPCWTRSWRKDAEKKAEEAADAHKAAFDFVKEALGDAVKEVKASARLKSHPVCLTAGEGSEL